jgi:hypothetical protein
MTSDRARHRNFRKFVAKGDEYLLYKGEFVNKINELNHLKKQSQDELNYLKK